MAIAAFSAKHKSGSFASAFSLYSFDDVRLFFMKFGASTQKSLNRISFYAQKASKQAVWEI
jgi:hypothetical protein